MLGTGVLLHCKWLLLLLQCGSAHKQCFGVLVVRYTAMVAQAVALVVVLAVVQRGGFVMSCFDSDPCSVVTRF
jgi:hypothetical protein